MPSIKELCQKKLENSSKNYLRKDLGPDNLISTFFKTFPKGEPQKV